MKKLLLVLALFCALPTTLQAADAPCVTIRPTSGPTGVPNVDAVIAFLIAQGYNVCDIAPIITGSEAISSSQLGIKLILASFGITLPVPYIEPIECPDLP